MTDRSYRRHNPSGKTKYLLYCEPCDGNARHRTRMKRLSFPASAGRITIEPPGIIRTRNGKRVHGVTVRYEEEFARVRNSVYRLPEPAWARTKVVALPRDAQAIRLADRPPIDPTHAAA